MGCCAFGLSRHGRTVRVLLGRAQAVCVVHGLARHGPTCRSGQAGPTDLSLGMVVPGWATHLAIYTWRLAPTNGFAPQRRYAPHERPASAAGHLHVEGTIASHGQIQSCPPDAGARRRRRHLVGGFASRGGRHWSGGWPAQPDHPGAMYIGSSVTLCVTFHILHQIRQFLLQDIQILCNLFIY